MRQFLHIPLQSFRFVLLSLVLTFVIYSKNCFVLIILLFADLYGETAVLFHALDNAARLVILFTIHL